MLGDVFHHLNALPKNLIVRMRRVPFIDSTGVNALIRFEETCQKKGVSLYLCEVNNDVLGTIEQSEFFTHFQKDRLLPQIEPLLMALNTKSD
jgi:SulP family sulfate permease